MKRLMRLSFFLLFAVAVVGEARSAWAGSSAAMTWMTSVAIGQAPVHRVQLHNDTGRPLTVRMRCAGDGNSWWSSSWGSVSAGKSITLPASAPLQKEGPRYRIVVEDRQGATWGKRFGGLIGKSWQTVDPRTRRPITYYSFTLK